MKQDGAALLLLVFVLVLAMLGVYLYVSGSSRRAALAERGRGGRDDAPMSRARHRFDARLRRTQSGRKLGNWLQGAGSPLSVGDLLLLCIFGTLIATVVVSSFVPTGIAFVFSALLAAGVARAMVERKRGRRRDEFINQLPDVARLLSNGTSAGLSMAGAIELAARELAQPAATEMGIVVQETRLGLPLEASLERLRERLPSREVAVLMTTLIIQQRAGGDTVRALSELGSTLEARKDLIREIRTVLSGSVFTSYVVAGIGIATIVLMNLFTPGVLREMTSSLPGLLALGAAGTLWAIAFVLIRATTKVDV
jgi:tight adherence protein B